MIGVALPAALVISAGGAARCSRPELISGLPGLGHPRIGGIASTLAPGGDGLVVWTERDTVLAAATGATPR